MSYPNSVASFMHGKTSESKQALYSLRRSTLMSQQEVNTQLRVKQFAQRINVTQVPLWTLFSHVQCAEMQMIIPRWYWVRTCQKVPLLRRFHRVAAFRDVISITQRSPFVLELKMGKFSDTREGSKNNLGSWASGAYA
jgi:hypothetical protein